MVVGLGYFIPAGFADDLTWAPPAGSGPPPMPERRPLRRPPRTEEERLEREVQAERLVPSHPHDRPFGREKRKDAHAPTPEAAQLSRDGRFIVSRDWMYDAQQVLDETSYVARLQRIKVYGRREEFYASVQQHQAEVKITGEDRFNLFVYLVRCGFVWRLKKFQLRFFELIMQTMAENIVGPSWATEGERLMRKHGWRSSPKVCAASAPRRFGKTVTLAVVMCAYVLVMAGKIQSVFSTGSRASGGLRDLVRKTLEESGMRDMLLTRGTASETVLVRSIYAQGPQFSTMNFYPSDEKVITRPLPHGTCTSTHTHTGSSRADTKTAWTRRRLKVSSRYYEVRRLLVYAQEGHLLCVHQPPDPAR